MVDQVLQAGAEQPALLLAPLVTIARENTPS